MLTPISTRNLGATERVPVQAKMNRIRELALFSAVFIGGATAEA
jgi:hypothetical protein